MEKKIIGYAKADTKEELEKLLMDMLEESGFFEKNREEEK